MRRFKSFPAVVLLLAAAPAAEKLPTGRGRDTVLRVCSRCHEVAVFTRQAHTRAEWSDIVKEMTNYGARANAPERKQIVNYLARTYPKK